MKIHKYKYLNKATLLATKLFWRCVRFHKIFDPIVESCLLWCTGPNAKGLKRAIQTHSTAFEKRVMQSVVGGQGFQKFFSR